MSSVNARGGFLFFDFRIRGTRCREYTKLADTSANRKKMEAALKKIDEEIASGTFDYSHFFPGSGMIEKLAKGGLTVSQSKAISRNSSHPTPLFDQFVEQWRNEKSVEWRASYLESVDCIIAKHLVPWFQGYEVGAIDRASIMSFRSHIAGGTTAESDNKKGRAPATVNRIMGILSMVLDEAAARHDIINPLHTVKRLKVQKSDIQPFTVEEVRALIGRIRPDYRDYLTVRFLTGMRSGEAHGLKWKHIDFARRQISVRETFTHGRTEYTKTDGSQRDISMSQPVFEALTSQKQKTGADAEGYVFCTREGTPIDNKNFDRRVWRPLLRHLNLKSRRPYQMRHTCATLWLAAGENPEWIARQLGHTNTEMLFRVYSRYVPNLTRQDGSAFDRMLASAITAAANTSEESHV